MRYNTITLAQDVERDQPRGISVIIAGAGVGGLMAAPECWRVGCDVKVLERATANITTGIQISLPCQYAASKIRLTD